MISDVSLHDIIITEEEVLNACNEINVNKASSVNNLSSRILKDAFTIFLM